MAAPPGWRMGDPTGTEVLELKDGRWGVDLLDGTVGCFTDREHAEQFIAQQNTKIGFGRRPPAMTESDVPYRIIEQAIGNAIATGCSTPDITSLAMSRLMAAGYVIVPGATSEVARLQEICRDIVDTINTDSRQWEEPPDYLGILRDIDEMAHKGYAPPDALETSSE